MTTAVTAENCLLHSCTQVTGNLECSLSQLLLLPTITCSKLEFRRQLT